MSFTKIMQDNKKTEKIFFMDSTKRLFIYAKHTFTHREIHI